MIATNTILPLGVTPVMSVFFFFEETTLKRVFSAVPHPDRCMDSI